MACRFGIFMYPSWLKMSDMWHHSESDTWHPYRGDKKEIIIDGRKSFSFDYVSPVNYHNREVYIPLSDGRYLLIGDSYKGPDRPKGFSIDDFQKILSTFKFTK